MSNQLIKFGNDLGVGSKNGLDLPKLDPVSGVLDTVLGHVTNMMAISEQGKTQRAAIQAQRDVFIEQIRAERDILMFDLEQKYKERGLAYDRFFKVIDKALESGDLQALQLGLSAVVQTIQHNPLPSRDDLRSALEHKKALDF